MFNKIGNNKNNFTHPEYVIKKSKFPRPEYVINDSSKNDLVDLSKREMIIDEKDLIDISKESIKMNLDVDVPISIDENKSKQMIID